MLSLILLFQKFSHEHPGHVFRIVTLKYKYYSMKVLHWWCFWYSYCMQFKLQKKLRNLQWQTFSQMYMMFPHPISTSRRNCLERQSEDTHGTTHQMFLPRLWRFFLYLEPTSNKGWIYSLEFFVITTIVIERFNACSFKGNMQLALSKVYFIHVDTPKMWTLAHFVQYMIVTQTAHLCNWIWAVSNKTLEAIFPLQLFSFL